MRFVFPRDLLEPRRVYEVAYGASESPAWVQEVAVRVKSRCFTVDLARTRSGEWLIVELGGGQVSGLPESVNLSDLFRRLAEVPA